jgi:hypothetical protein
MHFHRNTIFHWAKKLAEIEAYTFLFGPYLLLFPRREKSGAFVQRQTFCSSTSTIGISKQKKFLHPKFPLWGTGGLVII